MRGLAQNHNSKKGKMLGVKRWEGSMGRPSQAPLHDTPLPRPMYGIWGLSVSVY